MLEYKIVNCPHCGRIIPQHILNGELTRKKVSCPECGSQSSFRDGKRSTRDGKIQRYLCKKCGYRFSMA